MTEDSILDAKILVIDDHLENVELIVRILKHDGFRNIFELTNADGVVAAFSEFQPDLVLLDLKMPDIDGFAVLEKLSRRIKKDVFLPIVVVTADASMEAKRRALALGAKDFLTKPFDLIELLIRVRIQLETRRMFQRIKGANSMGESVDV